MFQYFYADLIVTFIRLSEVPSRCVCVRTLHLILSAFFDVEVNVG